MHVLIDALVLALSYVLSWYCYVRLGVMNNHPERNSAAGDVYDGTALYRARLSAALLCIQSLCIQAFSGKTSGICQYLKSEYGWISGLAGQLYMVRQVHFSRGMLCIFFVLNVTLETIVRNLIHYILSNMETRPQPEADSDGRLQPCDRGIH